jgi:phosphoenolpyruvate carboxylase
LGSYASWDETTKINFLQSELSGKRPLIDRQELDKYGFDETTMDVLRTVEIASTLGPEALGAYVISQATAASDVLAVMLLQKQFGMTPQSGKMMRVVPLFETLNDLTNAPQIVETLFSLPGYLGAVRYCTTCHTISYHTMRYLLLHLYYRVADNICDHCYELSIPGLCRGKQEIMVGYSDSAKDAGRLAAGWAQYVSQEEMVCCAVSHVCWGIGFRAAGITYAQDTCYRPLHRQ